MLLQGSSCGDASVDLENLIKVQKRPNIGVKWTYHDKRKRDPRSLFSDAVTDA